MTNPKVLGARSRLGRPVAALVLVLVLVVVVAGAACSRSGTASTIALVAEDGTVCVQLDDWLGGSRGSGGTVAPLPVPLAGASVRGTLELTSDTEGVFTPEGGGSSVRVTGGNRRPDRIYVTCAIR